MLICFRIKKSRFIELRSHIIELIGPDVVPESKIFKCSTGNNLKGCGGEFYSRYLNIRAKLRNSGFLPPVKKRKIVTQGQKSSSEFGSFVS